MNELAIIKELTRPHLQPKPFVYWFNLVITAVVAHSAFWISAYWTNQIGQFFLLVVGIFAHYRSIYLNHEITHAARHLSGFSWAYNFLFGFWTKFPTFLYFPHRYHHQIDQFATDGDPEFANIRGNRNAIYFVPTVIALLVPIVLFVRFALLPILLPVLPKRYRDFIYRNLSAIALNPKFKRPLPNRQETAEWIVQDFFCWLYWWLFLAAIYFDLVPIKAFWFWSFIASGVFLLNHFRAMSAHFYDLHDFRQDFEYQANKSVTICKTGLWTHLWAPMGIQYHALHHLSPMLPYHELKLVHEKILSHTPAIQIYRNGLRQNYCEVIKEQSVV